jgi:hypothetical protein
MPRRTSSGNTVQQIKGPRVSSQPVTPTLETKEPRWESQHDRRPSTSRREQAPAAAAVPKSPTLEEEEDFISSSSESNSDPEIDAASRRRGYGFKRFGRFSTHRPGLREDDDDDDDESPAFLPLSRGPGSASRGASGHDLSATLRTEQEGISAPQRRVTEPAQGLKKSMTAESSGSSVSSGAPVSHSHTQLRRQMNHPSPRRTAELAHMSPRRSTTSGRDISDGTPSMGSSFSDLDGMWPSLTPVAFDFALELTRLF